MKIWEGRELVREHRWCHGRIWHESQARLNAKKEEQKDSGNVRWVLHCFQTKLQEKVMGWPLYFHDDHLFICQANPIRTAAGLCTKQTVVISNSGSGGNNSDSIHWLLCVCAERCGPKYWWSCQSTWWKLQTVLYWTGRARGLS